MNRTGEAAGFDDCYAVERAVRWVSPIDDPTVTTGDRVVSQGVRISEGQFQGSQRREQRVGRAQVHQLGVDRISSSIEVTRHPPTPSFRVEPRKEREGVNRVLIRISTKKDLSSIR